MYTFLLVGVLLNKPPLLRKLIEEHAYHLTDHRHMSDLVPFILPQEKEKIKQEIIDKAISLVFYDTIRLGELFVIVVHFIESEWNIQHRMIRLQVLAKSMTGDEIAHQVINTLYLEYGI